MYVYIHASHQLHPPGGPSTLLPTQFVYKKKMENEGKKKGKPKKSNLRFFENIQRFVVATLQSCKDYCDNCHCPSRIPNTHALCILVTLFALPAIGRGGGAGVETQKNVRGEIGDGVEYHLMSPTPRR